MQSCKSSGPLTVTDVRGPFFVLSWVMAAPGLGRAHPPPWLDVLHSHPYAPRGAFPLSLPCNTGGGGWKGGVGQVWTAAALNCLGGSGGRFAMAGRPLELTSGAKADAPPGWSWAK